MSKELPILFKGEMVRAVIDGIKARTRRLLKSDIPANKLTLIQVAHVTPYDSKYFGTYAFFNVGAGISIPKNLQRRPFTTPPDVVSYKAKYTVGDKLWVKETSRLVFNVDLADNWPDRPHIRYYAANGITTGAIIYRADGDTPFVNLKGEEVKKNKWTSSMFMLKTRTRVWLEVTNVSIERLQGITESEAQLEGVKKGLFWIGGNITDSDDSDVFNQCATYLHGFEKLWKVINGSASWEANPWVWVYSFKVLSITDDFKNKQLCQTNTASENSTESLQ